MHHKCINCGGEGYEKVKSIGEVEATSFFVLCRNCLTYFNQKYGTKSYYETGDQT